MTKLTDELLAAYEDGELSQEEAEFVEAELRRDPESRARLEAFRQVSALLRTAHSEAEQHATGASNASYGGRGNCRLGLLPKALIMMACAIALLLGLLAIF